MSRCSIRLCAGHWLNLPCSFAAPFGCLFSLDIYFRVFCFFDLVFQFEYEAFQVNKFLSEDTILKVNLLLEAVRLVYN